MRPAFISISHSAASCPGCADYGLLHKIGGSLVSSPGKTKLDRERSGLCLAEIVSITSSRY